MDRIHRISMFKVAKPEDQKKFIEQYNTLKSTAVKDGKPYILSLVMGFAAVADVAQGYTVVAKTEFANQEDHDFYDSKCPAHQALKVYVRGNIKVDGIPLTVHFPATVVG